MSSHRADRGSTSAASKHRVNSDKRVIMELGINCLWDFNVLIKKKKIDIGPFHRSADWLDSHRQTTADQLIKK